MTLGWIYLLPTNTQKVIFKYRPKWLISCVIPASAKLLRFNKYDYSTDELVGRDLMLEFPSLILSHSIRKPWVKPKNIELGLDLPYFQIHGIDLSSPNTIKALPYRLANVYSSGTICFGEVTLDNEPTNLREANNLFWGTPFNDDGSIFYDQHARVCDNREHEYYEHTWPEDLHGCDLSKKQHVKGCKSRQGLHCACPCSCSCCLKICDCKCGCECCMNVCGCACACDLTEPLYKWVENYNKEFLQREFVVKTNYFCGSKYFATNNPTKALFFSNNDSLKRVIPEKYWRRDAQNCQIVIGTAQRNDKSWDIDLGSFQFTLAKTDAEVL